MDMIIEGDFFNDANWARSYIISTDGFLLVLQKYLNRERLLHTIQPIILNQLNVKLQISIFPTHLKLKLINLNKYHSTIHISI